MHSLTSISTIILISSDCYNQDGTSLTTGLFFSLPVSWWFPKDFFFKDKKIDLMRW